MRVVYLKIKIGKKLIFIKTFCINLKMKIILLHSKKALNNLKLTLNIKLIKI